MRRTLAALLAVITPTIASGAGYDGYRTRLAALEDVTSGGPSALQVDRMAPTCGTIEQQRGAHYVRARTPHHIKATLSDFAVFAPNRDTLWPGAFVRYSSLDGGNPALINVPRNPIDLTIDVSHSTQVRARGVEATAGAVSAAINKLLIANPQGYPARSTFRYADVHSVNQSLLEIGLSAESLTTRVTASLTKKKRVENSVVLADFTQIYYTVSLDLPNEGNHTLFAPGLSRGVLDATFTPKDPPLYISQVSYGRRMLFRIESQRSFSEVRAAMRVAHDFIAGKVSLSVAQSSLETLDKTEFQLVIVGGNPDAASRVITTRDFLTFITTNTTPSAQSPGVPISYTVKQLRDNKTVALKRTEDFDAVDYSQLVKQVRIVIEKIEVHNDGDGGLEGAGDFIWKFWANGRKFGERRNPVSISSGRSKRINQSFVVGVPVSDTSELVLKAKVTDVDDSSPDDHVDWQTPYRAVALSGMKRERRRESNNGDPSITLHWRVEVLGDNSGTACVVR